MAEGLDVNKIAEALRNAASSGVRNLNYRFEGNAVKITGEADTIAAKQQAFRAVTAAVGDVGVVNAITIHQPAAAAAPAQAPAQAQAAPPQQPAASGAIPAANVIPPVGAGGDPNAILELKAREQGEKLDWKHSVVDLMKLLGMDSSLDTRKKLAARLGFQGDTGDSAKMNMWLHEQLMNQVATRGANLPKDLLA